MFTATAANAQSPLVVGVGVRGNSEVVDEHILSVVGTKIGEPLDQDQIQEDIDAIYGLGFFSLVDVSVTPQMGGAYVEFQVVENPVIEKVIFTGNTVFTDEELMELLFTRPGAIFNRVFFRHDLQRVIEKYEKAGYTMVRVEDVRVEAGTVEVRIIEPVVGDIIIQGNTRTKSYVIEREITFKKGDLFNTTLLRHSLASLNQLGFFDDVSLGFEPSEEDPSVINLVFTVEEKRTTRLGLSIGHGTSSGWSGGASGTESNLGGRGHIAEVSFETGDREQYWITYREPYMDQEHYSWRVGFYKRDWEDVEDNFEGETRYEYDEERTGFYAGMGKKFRNDEKLSWYATLDWHNIDLSNIRNRSGNVIPPDEFIDHEERAGDTYSITGTLTYNNRTKYIAYPEGQVYSLSIEQGLFESDYGGDDMNYTKYWVEGRFYWPLREFLGGLIDLDIGSEEDPVIFASRVRYGSSSGSVPWSEKYELGGDKTLRGYEDDEFRGDEMVLGNFELRLPVQEALSFVFFYDTGFASDDFSFSDVKDSVGFGIRVRTPLGNLRLDVAEGDYETYTHFGFGELF
ncbi:MAG TPA: outer membrane protein assembly factor [Synergistaceae bacterium]|nr:outer membrane protein assembly factor [Synergistaceae bacterium]